MFFFKRIFLSLAILTLALLPTASRAVAESEGIAAVVNQDAITMTDLNDRMHLIIVSAGLAPTKEIQDKLMGQVLDDLINEQLKLQEAKKDGVTVSPEEVSQGFAMLAAQNKLTMEQFSGAMKHDGINMATIERQVRAQIGWGKVVQQKLRSQVTVTDTDIDDYIARITAAKGKSEYALAEIFLPVGDGKPEADAQQLAQRLVSEINAGKAPFYKVAQQFSSAAGASHGGDLGWVQQGQLDPDLEAAITGLAKGQTSQPVKLADGYHILYLRDVRTVTDDNIPPREKIYSTIGLERLTRLAERTLLDLRTSAFIENRVQS